MTKLEELQHLLRLGRISRREFLVRASALGAVSAVAPSLMPKTARAAVPKKGGRLRMGIGHGSTSDSLDPGTHENGYSQNTARTYANTLTEVSNTGQLIPELAESWEASDDAKDWVFKLRKGVEFHNGKTMTADDVITSINHHRGEDTKSAAKPLFDALEEIVKDDEDTLIFRLESGNADFPFLVTDYHTLIMPSVDGKIDWRSGIGTGAYVIQSFEPGVRVFYKRNPNYFKEGRAHFDEVEALSIIDANARQNALATGEVDVIDKVDTKTVRLLARKPGVKILETTGTLHYSFPMHTDKAPFDNNDVRMALKLSVDRDQLVEKILHGHGALGNDHPISTANRFHASELPQRPYDPEKAKWHLKQADMQNLTVDLSAADAAFNGAVDAAVLMKEHAKPAGITINVVREPNDGYWANVWTVKPWVACYWGGRPTEDWMFSAAYAEGADWNDSNWKHERFNKLLIEARAQLNEAKRREMYVEMQRITRDEGGVLVPMFANHVMALNEKVQHDEEVAGNWQLDGNRCAERWWFA
jgi:peptide/nickel transport system substrate-binding protein